MLQNWRLSLAVICVHAGFHLAVGQNPGRSETYFIRCSSSPASCIPSWRRPTRTTRRQRPIISRALRRAPRRRSTTRRASRGESDLSLRHRPAGHVAASNSLAYIAINLLGGWLIVRQGVPVGVIVTLRAVRIGSFLEPLEQISNGLSTPQQAKARLLQRVVDLLELPEEAPIERDLPAGGDGSVEFRHVDLTHLRAG
ncbi:MAG: hypothetical protein ACLUN5_16515 [Oscillospiraceae bacterium]